MKRAYALSFCVLALVISIPAESAAANPHYVVNRAPLRQTAFVHLPPGAVRPGGSGLYRSCEYRWATQESLD